MAAAATAHASFSTRRTNAINAQRPTAAQQEVQGPCPISADLVGGEYDPPDLAPDSAPESPLPSDALHW
ncbi:hypothetical protein PHYSODRAFT_285131 [Phytophthora sojae]|uniref:Uncharacterized protein n=1 Tax=Phytophthora sojae (strain P6497) TaxID=1094619 RepID=G4Z1K8_PHYSP|nr:hypothetical protein PHYSODRAFT_285131 [Phytophthora sojae]EGZ25919.1 hypothetical protein PHYSODRAFT_285131 [Phytophthora sojae]|eukprot:XP_009521207.1 hypothetical protein PHYSODRAFT_285131 [Phytophthora sojae]